MNAETEHRLSDEYQSQTEIEPVRPKDKVGIYKISQFVICYNFDIGQPSTRTKCEQSLAQHGKPGQHVARKGERFEARTSRAETDSSVGGAGGKSEKSRQSCDERERERDSQ